MRAENTRLVEEGAKVIITNGETGSALSSEIGETTCSSPLRINQKD